MTTYSQANRPLRVSTALGPDALLLTSFSGVEGVSTPFRYQLELASEDPAVDAEGLLRTPAVVTLVLPDGSERTIHGLVSRFSQLGRRDDLAAYGAEIVPWLSFLALSRDCKIFQNLSVPEIAEKVFRDQGYADFELRLSGSYPKREFCVQYRETHLDFVSRLLEEEGILYAFEHSDSRHLLVLSDRSAAASPCPGSPSARMAQQPTLHEDVVLTLQRDHAVHVGSVALRDYDYLKPALGLDGAVAGSGKEEVYDYPGAFSTLEDGDRLARIRLEAEEALRHVVRGSGNCRAFRSGHRFDLKDHFRPDANQPYLLLEVQHAASAGDFRSDQTAPFDYSNQFLAIPCSVPFRPRRRTPKPVVQGSQTAVVVGKAGEEIWVDRYGRVKVQFHWDRDGQRDENSSCWVRVSSSWAGKGWGAVQIPRVGQEVLVDFLDGDPDRPIITGRVYNAEQMPPYALPANQTQSGVRSRSSKGAGAENFNELRFEDRKGSEEVFLQAEKDLAVVVKNDEVREVRHDRTTTVRNHETRTIAEGNETVTIARGDQATELKTGNQTTVLGQGNQEVTLKMGDQVTKLDMGDLVTKLGLGKATHEAMQGIEFRVGQSSVKIDQAGVTIRGMAIKIEGKVQTQIKGLQTQIDGSAMLRIKGGVTTIN